MPRTHYSDIPITTPIRSTLCRHKWHDKFYGIWLRLSRAREIIPQHLLPAKTRRVPFGLAGTRLVMALGAPRRYLTVKDVAAAIPTRKLWDSHDGTPIQWFGFIALRRESTFLARAYVPAKWTNLRRLTDTAHEMMANLRIIPGGWVVLESDPLDFLL
jgi:hypothetical protein